MTVAHIEHSTRPTTVSELAQLAVDAQLTEHHLSNLRDLARPHQHELAIPFRDTARAAHEIMVVGHVVRAAHCANRFLAVVADTFDERDLVCASCGDPNRVEL